MDTQTQITEIYYNISDKYGDYVQVTEDDYCDLNVDGEFETRYDGIYEVGEGMIAEMVETEIEIEVIAPVVVANPMSQYKIDTQPIGSDCMYQDEIYSIVGLEMKNKYNKLYRLEGRDGTSILVAKTEFKIMDYPETCNKCGQTDMTGATFTTLRDGGICDDCL